MNLLKGTQLQPTETQVAIVNGITNMKNMVLYIEANDFPQKIKDDSKREFIKALDFIIKELSPMSINKLIIEAYRKRKVNG